MANDTNEIKFEILKDYGAFGEGKWQKHLTKISWNGGEPKFDVRAWNEDMTKMGKGITLDDADAYDLMCLLEKALDE